MNRKRKVSKRKTSYAHDEFLVKDMECTSCEKIISKATLKLNGVKEIRVDYASGKANVNYNPKKATLAKIFRAIENKGYVCEKKAKKMVENGRIYLRKSDIKNATVTLGLLILALGAYSLLSETFESSIPVIGQDTSILLLFIIGLFTGFHCIAMCGGFVVSYSTKEVADTGVMKFGSHITYGLAKTLSYAFFGFVFGFIGSFFTFTPLIRGVAAVLAGIFLVMFGLNMLNMMNWFKRFRLRTPSFLDKLVLNKTSESKSPMMIGLLTGLMIACGPLQAIYLLAAASGSPYYGAIYLAAFGLGTLPVLLGFGVLTSVLSARHTNRLIRYSGVLVLLLGLIMVNRGIALSGTGYDLNTITASMQPITVSAEGGNVIKLNPEGYQEIRMEVNRYGWKPDKFLLKKGVPVKWIIEGKEINRCNNAIQVPKLGLNFDIKRGLQTIEFTPPEEGTISWSCWMGMIPGVFLVKDDINVDNAAEIQGELDKVEVPSGGSCGGNCGGAGCGCGCGGRRR